jgi:omega-6 fatty acid desaturase (delta-12 desaturase)
MAYSHGWIPFYALYSAIQGTVVMGFMVIGHECGHGAFSEYPVINDFVGYILHTGLLVPYFAWQKTHATHHSRANHTIDGETHVPGTMKAMKKPLTDLAEIIGEDAFVILQILERLLVGWPTYLLVHMTGSRRSPITKERYKRSPNHFNPYGELFADKLRFKIALGTTGVAAMVATLAYTGYWRLYLGPYMVVNAWLVLYTWLQHTSKDIPHYGDKEWTWLKGALCTVDRPYPWIIDELHHHLGSTHVCHHLFHEIPHYHAVEATKALKAALGTQYRYDKTPIARATWNTARECHYVDGVEGVQYYKAVF